MRRPPALLKISRPNRKSWRPAARRADSDFCRRLRLLDDRPSAVEIQQILKAAADTTPWANRQRSITSSLQEHLEPENLLWARSMLASASDGVERFHFMRAVHRLRSRWLARIQQGHLDRTALAEERDDRRKRGSTGFLLTNEGAQCLDRRLWPDMVADYYCSLYKSSEEHTAARSKALAEWEMQVELISQAGDLDRICISMVTLLDARGRLAFNRLGGADGLVVEMLHYFSDADLEKIRVRLWLPLSWVFAFQKWYTSVLLLVLRQVLPPWTCSIYGFTPGRQANEISELNRLLMAKALEWHLPLVIAKGDVFWAFDKMALGDMVRDWRLRGIGFTLKTCEGADYVLSHAFWADVLANEFAIQRGSCSDLHIFRPLATWVLKLCAQFVFLGVMVDDRGSTGAAFCHRLVQTMKHFRWALTPELAGRMQSFEWSLVRLMLGRNRCPGELYIPFVRRATRYALRLLLQLGLPTLLEQVAREIDSWAGHVARMDPDGFHLQWDQHFFDVRREQWVTMAQDRGRWRMRRDDFAFAAAQRLLRCGQPVQGKIFGSDADADDSYSNADLFRDGVQLLSGGTARIAPHFLQSFISFADVLMASLRDCSAPAVCSFFFLSGDSLLVVSQLLGSWRCRSAGLRALLACGLGLLQVLRACGCGARVSWRPRLLNWEADAVQIAFDRLNTCGVDLYDVSPGEYGADGIPVGTNQLQVYVPTGRGLGSACNKPARWILVLPRSGNSLDLSRAAIIPLYDLGPTVPALLELDSFSFSDTDPAPGQVGGTVEWALKYPDMDTAYIEYYSVYLASDPNGAQQVSVGQVLRGTNQLVIPSGTSQTENSCGCVLMYPKNAIGLSASPAGHFCFESDGETYTTTTATSTSTVTMTATVTTLDPSQVVVTNLLFDDTNEDAMLLAGTLSWDPPGNSAQ
ncbi:unnamed protein product, partial [Polarella glacialis]